MSFFTWMRVTTRYGPILNFETGSSDWGVHIFVHEKNGTPAFYVSINNRNNPSSDYSHLEEIITPNTWTYVGFTYDYKLGQFKYYKDGVFIKEIRNNWKVELATQYKVCK